MKQKVLRLTIIVVSMSITFNNRTLEDFNNGINSFKNKDYQQALRYFEKIINTIPETHNAYFNAALCCMQLQKWESAAYHFKEAIKRAPDNFNAHFYYARALRNTNKIYEASVALEHALKIQPNNINALFELGVLYTEQYCYDKALICYDKILREKPRFIPALRNAGHTARYKGDVKKATDYYQRAIAFAPQEPHLHYGLAESLLMQGNFKNGWKAFEWRWKRMPDKRMFSEKLWDGKTDLFGKTIVIRAEYGQGDSMQFIRYAQLLKQRGAIVIFEAQHSLLDLFKLSPYIDRCIKVRENKPLEIPYDYQIPIMSLPYVFETWSEENIPKTIPYLWAKEELIHFWKQKIAHDNNFKIGICWQGCPYYETFKSPLSRKSVPLKLFAQLAYIDGVSLYSLQKINGLDELETLDNVVIHSYDDFDCSHGRFMDTAALIKNLNLVITVDTSIAHLAGALDTPVWVLLPYVADWRWMQHRSDSPWYPSMRLFRQLQSDSWQGVMDQIIKELRLKIT